MRGRARKSGQAWSIAKEASAGPAHLFRCSTFSKDCEVSPEVCLIEEISVKYANREEARQRAKLSIFALVRNLREQRHGGVQTDQQYAMIYQYYGRLYQELLD